MARNGSGTYSLPAGNPVTGGTTISSTWANNTLSDIGTALTGSLAKDGQTVPTNNLPMGGFKLTGLAAGSANGESVRFEQLPTLASLGAAASGANTDITSLASPNINAATATTQTAGDNSTKVATTAFLNANAVTLTGAQTVAGVKTLSNTPILSAGATFGSATMANPSGSTPVFGARAWCMFDGTATGTNAPSAGGNVTNVTRNATGDYTINFTTAMPDSNYGVAITGATDPSFGGTAGFNGAVRYATRTTTSVRIMLATATGGSFADAYQCSVVIFR
jgi:hypothetical protein